MVGDQTTLVTLDRVGQVNAGLPNWSEYDDPLTGKP